MKLSIIIPVYNVEALVERCIRSVAEQNIGPNEYEIIIVNDGSTDNSLKICEQVSSDYKHIKIHSQTNSGLGGARNKGLSLATGEYIWFIDSDDFIAPNVLQEMIQKVERFDLDILAFDFNCTDIDGNKIDWINFKFNFNGQEILTGPEFYYLNYNDSYIWLYFFRRELLLNNNLKFEERVNMQDSEILPRIMHHVKSVAFLNKEIYSYVNRPDSFINNRNKNVRIKYYKSVLTVSHLLSKFQSGLYEESLISKALKFKLQEINRILFFSFLYDPFDKDSLKEILVETKKNNLYPFKSFSIENKTKYYIYNTLRVFINKYPIKTRQIFWKLKSFL